jgi:hypothetical protein
MKFTATLVLLLLVTFPILGQTGQGQSTYLGKVTYGNCGNGDTKSSYSSADPKNPAFRACGVLVHYVRPSYYSVDFHVQDLNDRVKDQEDSHKAESHISIDTDTHYTERVEWTEYSEPVTADRVQREIDGLIMGFKHYESASTYNGVNYPAHFTDVRIESRRNVVTSQGYKGLEVTADDDSSHNAYFRVLAVGNRLYRLTVIADATEEPDEPAFTHKIEANRYFDSFQDPPKVPAATPAPTRR